MAFAVSTIYHPLKCCEHEAGTGSTADVDAGLLMNASKVYGRHKKREPPKGKAEGYLQAHERSFGPDLALSFLTLLLSIAAIAEYPHLEPHVAWHIVLRLVTASALAELHTNPSLEVWQLQAPKRSV
eukprot:1143034-Amphidinium_carterae.1